MGTYQAAKHCNIHLYAWSMCDRLSRLQNILVLVRTKMGTRRAGRGQAPAGSHENHVCKWVRMVSASKSQNGCGPVRIGYNTCQSFQAEPRHLPARFRPGSRPFRVTRETSLLGHSSSWSSQELEMGVGQGRPGQTGLQHPLAYM